eukprot:SAG22_NODE_2496_length_2510_cov_2.147657_1_plen_57_part_10
MGATYRAAQDGQAEQAAGAGARTATYLALLPGSGRVRGVRRADPQPRRAIAIATCAG